MRPACLPACIPAVAAAAAADVDGQNLFTAAALLPGWLQQGLCCAAPAVPVCNLPLLICT